MSESPPPPGWEPPTVPPPPPPAPPPGAQPGWGVPPPPTGSTLPPPPTGAPAGVAYGYGYAPTGGAVGRRLGGLATALTVLLGITGVAALGVAGALANRASVLDGPFTFAELEDADDVALATAALAGILQLVTAIVWITWQFRFAKNAEVLGKRDGLGPGWAIGGWLIPIANLILGPLQLQQSAKASDPDAPPGQGRVPGVLVLWWALWVLQSVLGFSSGRFGFGTDTDADVDIDEFRSSDQLGGVGAGLVFLAALAAIVLVRQLTARQQQALEQRGMVR